MGDQTNGSAKGHEHLCFRQSRFDLRSKNLQQNAFIIFSEIPIAEWALLNCGHSGELSINTEEAVLCVHTSGGAKVLEGIGKNLQLSEHMLAPSYSVLWNYGNVSSSTTWYTLSNIESLRGVEKGDTIMQVISFFKKHVF